MEEAGGRECEESRVEDRGSCRLNKMGEGVRAIAEGMRCIYPPSVTRKKNGLKLDEDDNEKAQSHN